MFSRGFRVAVRNRNLPSVFLNKNVVSSRRNLSSSTDWLKKFKGWKVAQSFFNPNVFINLCHRLLPSFASFAIDMEEGKDDDDIVEDPEFKKVFKEGVKIHRVLLDYDEPYKHVIDGVNALSNVLYVWKRIRPDFKIEYYNLDIVIPRNLYRVSAFLEDKEATRKKTAERAILKLLLGYDDPKFADLVLLEALRFWKMIISGVEIECMKEWTTNNKDKHDGDELKNPIPQTVIMGLKTYKGLFNDLGVDNPYELVRVIKDVKEMVDLKMKNEMARDAKMEKRN